MKIQVKKMIPDARIPKKAHITDACWDLYSVSMTVTKNYIEYGTGIAINIPPGYVGLLYPRSSVSRRSLIMANCVGVVDSGYQGEVLFRFKQVPETNTMNKYYPGDRVGQLKIVKLPEITLDQVEEFDNTTERGTGGFGSTGK